MKNDIFYLKQMSHLVDLVSVMVTGDDNILYNIFIEGFSHQPDIFLFDSRYVFNVAAEYLEVIDWKEIWVWLALSPKQE